MMTDVTVDVPHSEVESDCIKMSSETIREDLEEIVKKLMEKEGVTTYELKIEGQSEVGDNYMGEIIFFKIISQNGAIIHDLVMKTAKRSEEFRNALPVEHVYNRELYMYSKVFPEFRKFLEEVDPMFEFDFVPKLVWISSDAKKETLIFNNLKGEGYKLRERQKPWNLQHSLFTMEHYGKYHGISLALQDQKPELFNELRKNLKNLSDKFSGMMDVNKFYKEHFGRTMNVLKEAGRQDLIDKYESFLDETIPLMKGADEDDKIVITHGDCWNNNFMFKYKDENETKPWKMCFLDFQVSSIETPIADLGYNIFSSCDNTCLQHLDQILDTYYNSLSETVRRLGSNPDVLFSREKFKKHWEKYAKQGVLLSILIFRILLTEKEDVPDMVKNAEDGKNLDECFDIVVRDKNEYDRRVLDVYSFYGEKYL